MSSRSEAYETLLAVSLVCLGVMLGTVLSAGETSVKPVAHEQAPEATKCYVLAWEVPEKVKLYEEKE